MKKLIGVAVLPLMLCGCMNDAVETKPTTNRAMKVELLFEHDGVKVYRFYDGNPIYYTDARGSVYWNASKARHSVETVK